jgi:multidrug efflux pump
LRWARPCTGHQRINGTLPAGVKLVNVQDQPKSVATSVNEFVKVLIEAVVIVLAVSFISLGLHKRPGNHPLWKRWYIDPRPGWWWASPFPWCWP